MPAMLVTISDSHKKITVKKSTKKSNASYKGLDIASASLDIASASTPQTDQTSEISSKPFTKISAANVLKQSGKNTSKSKAKSSSKSIPATASVSQGVNKAEGEKIIWG